VLEIELLRYETVDFATTAVIPGFGYLADLFPDPYLVKWEIDGGLARSEELPGVAVPEDAFAGVIGVAPSHERLEAIRQREETLRDRGQPVADSMPEGAVPPEAAEGLRTIPPRELGGNLDIRQLVAGSRLWLPVDVPGALFSLGDLHFAQGDGEVCGTAIEVAGAVTVRFQVIRDAAHRGRFPAFETPGGPARRSFATTGIPVDVGMDLNAAAREALIEMIDHLEATYGFERPAAYALCSATVDLRISEVVDVPYPVVSALLPLDVFESG
jgi:formamidase